MEATPYRPWSHEAMLRALATFNDETLNDETRCYYRVPSEGREYMLQTRSGALEVECDTCQEWVSFCDMASHVAAHG